MCAWETAATALSFLICAFTRGMFCVASSENPNGIPSQSPGLRGTSYPGSPSAKIPNRNAVAAIPVRPSRATFATTALRLNPFPHRDPRQPWAGGRNPVGIGRGHGSRITPIQLPCVRIVHGIFNEHRIAKHPRNFLDAHIRALQESQRDSVPKPRVARNELPWVTVRKKFPTATRLRPFRFHHKLELV